VNAGERDWQTVYDLYLLLSSDDRLKFMSDMRGRDVHESRASDDAGDDATHRGVKALPLPAAGNTMQAGTAGVINRLGPPAFRVRVTPTHRAGGHSQPESHSWTTLP
jgi:hypothetical protein